VTPPIFTVVPASSFPQAAKPVAAWLAAALADALAGALAWALAGGAALGAVELGATEVVPGLQAAKMTAAANTAAMLRLVSNV